MEKRDVGEDLSLLCGLYLRGEEIAHVYQRTYRTYAAIRTICCTGEEFTSENYEKWNLVVRNRVEQWCETCNRIRVVQELGE